MQKQPAGLKARPAESRKSRMNIPDYLVITNLRKIRSPPAVILTI